MTSYDLGWLSGDIATLLERAGYEIKNETIANKAAYLTVVMNGKEYDVSIKDASLREESK